MTVKGSLPPDAWERLSTPASKRPEKAAAADTRAAIQAERLALMQIQRRKLEGELIERATAQLAVYARAKAERDAHLAWLQRLTPVLAGELDVDAKLLFARLDHHLREHLDGLSRLSLDVLDG